MVAFSAVKGFFVSEQDKNSGIEISRLANSLITGLHINISPEKLTKFI
jgi:hypothetical protein